MANTRFNRNRKYNDVELSSLLPGASNKNISEPPYLNSVTCLASVREGVCLMGSDDAAVKMHDFYEGKELHHWMKHQQSISRVAFHKTEQVAVSASRDRFIMVWREGEIQALQAFEAHTLPITGLGVSPDGRTVCTGSRDNSLKLWDLKTGQQLSSCKISRNLVSSLKWSYRSHLIAQVSEDKELRLWDSRSLQIIHAFPTQQYIQTCVDISYCDNYILTGTSGTHGTGCVVSIWDIRKREMLRQFHGHNETITGCLFLSSSNTYVVCKHPQFATVALDQTVRVWDQELGDCLTVLPLDRYGPLNDIAEFDDGSIGIATHQTGVLRLFRGRSHTGEWVLHLISSF